MRCHPLAIFGAHRAAAFVLWVSLLGCEVSKDSLWPAGGMPGPRVYRCARSPF